MATGCGGTFVISWPQTEINGLQDAPLDALEAGAEWSWHGEAVRVDPVLGLLRQDAADAGADPRRRAARAVQRLVGAAMQNRRDPGPAGADEPLVDRSFTVTNGVQSHTVTLVAAGPGQRPLLMFHGGRPPRNTGLWVAQHDLGSFELPQTPSGGGVICFTPGTAIATPDGPKLVEDLREGGKVLTRDNGAQEILWIGARRMSGARLYAMPQLRPVRIRAGALGIGRPGQELLVSPGHRMLLRGPQVRALFNEPEVLAAARDLVASGAAAADRALREVTYIHLLLPSHQVIWANGLETESFHPAHAALPELGSGGRKRLQALLPEVDADPMAYGGFARRSLSAPEAAVLMREAA